MQEHFCHPATWRQHRLTTSSHPLGGRSRTRSLAHQNHRLLAENACWLVRVGRPGSSTPNTHVLCRHQMRALVLPSQIIPEMNSKAPRPEDNMRRKPANVTREARAVCTARLLRLLLLLTVPSEETTTAWLVRTIGPKPCSSRPQCRHTFAAAGLSPKQCGHFTVSSAINPPLTTRPHDVTGIFRKSRCSHTDSAWKQLVQRALVSLSLAFFSFLGPFPRVCGFAA